MNRPRMLVGPGPTFWWQAHQLSRVCRYSTEECEAVLERLDGAGFSARLVICVAAANNLRPLEVATDWESGRMPLAGLTDNDAILVLNTFAASLNLRKTKPQP